MTSVSVAVAAASLPVFMMLWFASMAIANEAWERWKDGDDHAELDVIVFLSFASLFALLIVVAIASIYDPKLENLPDPVLGVILVLGMFSAPQGLLTWRPIVEYAMRRCTARKRSRDRW